MNKEERYIKIRTKALGALMYDARLAARRSAEECARVMDITPEKYQDYESGREAPSLPALESLAYFLNVPLEHFWGHRSLSEQPAPLTEENGRRLRQLRDRLIGARIRKARSDANLALKELSELTSIPEEELRRSELGQVAIPLPALETLSKTLNIPVEEFYDRHGPIGQWRSVHESVREFAELPPEFKQFVVRPVNRPYIELAIRLSELQVEKLRAIAEGLLEITY